MSFKQFDITNWLIFVVIYIVGLQIGNYVSTMFSIAGYLASALALSVVFLVASWILGFRMTWQNWIIFVLFGFISTFIGSWVASSFGLAGIIVSFLTGTILYFLAKNFTATATRTLKQVTE